MHARTLNQHRSHDPTLFSLNPPERTEQHTIYVHCRRTCTPTSCEEKTRLTVLQAAHCLHSLLMLCPLHPHTHLPTQCTELLCCSVACLIIYFQTLVSESNRGQRGGKHQCVQVWFSNFTPQQRTITWKIINIIFNRCYISCWLNNVK